VYDDYAKNKLNIYFSSLGKIFDLPIAEIIDKKHHGILFFSKIKLEMILFLYGLKKTSFMLDPVEITYYDYFLDIKKKIWHERYFKALKKKVDTTDYFLKRVHMRNAIFRWMDKERIDFFSVIDFDPFLAIRHDRGHELNEEEFLLFSQTMDDRKKKLKEINEKNDTKEKKKILFKKRYNSLIKKGTFKLKKEQKYLYPN